MTSPTLYERMGGDNAVMLAIMNFFEQIGNDTDLQPFFENISIDALRAHQLKLFKVIFGPEEEKPDPDEFLNFMLATHTRLFRDMGLNETHFDKVAACFVRALEELQADPDVIDESVAILVPLRAVFEFGAKVAEREKSFTPQELKLLPTTTAKNMTCAEPTTLPDPCHIDIPFWLEETLQQHSKNPEVRAWTKDMTDRFGAAESGDEIIKDQFLDMPYMNHHVYCAAILQLAFMPDGYDDDANMDSLQIIKYPRGPNNSRLVESLWNRMILGFEATCDAMGMDAETKARGVQNLKFHSFAFPSKKAVHCGGATAPHVLRRVPKATFDMSEVQKENVNGQKPSSTRKKAQRRSSPGSKTNKTSELSFDGASSLAPSSTADSSENHADLSESHADFSESQDPSGRGDGSRGHRIKEHKTKIKSPRSCKKGSTSSKSKKKRTRSVWSKLLGWVTVQ